MELIKPFGRDDLCEQVIALAKTAKKTVGFRTDSVFVERARQGTLLACVDGGTVLGYLLYGLPRDLVRVDQLVVCEAARGRGVARRLIDAVASEHGDRRGMALRCRNDFPAHAMWPRLDFAPVSEQAGRSFDGKPLTRWFRSFGHPDLFSQAGDVDVRPIAVLDACVFIDLIDGEPDQVAQQLKADWLGEHVRLRVVDHLLVEIAREGDPERRAAQRAAAESLRVTGASDAWRPFRDRLHEMLPETPEDDEDDLAHLAQSAAAEAAWLITSDGAFRHRYTDAASSLDVRLVDPAGFIREIDESTRADRYRPQELADTSVTRREADSASLPGLANLFVRHAAGEKLRTVRATVAEAAARPDAVRLEVVDVNGEPQGLFAWEVAGNQLLVPLLRTRRGSGEPTIGRHLLSLLRREAADAHVATIRITDRLPSAATSRSFREEGFARDGDDVVAHVLQGTGTLAELGQRAADLGSPLADRITVGRSAEDSVERAAAAERWFTPFRVVKADVPCFCIPIRPGWASGLFDETLSEQQLFHREWQLGLRRELVYYRKPANSRGLAAPARLLWYVSGDPRLGGGTVRATSHLIEVSVDKAEHLYHRYKRLGVYDMAAVQRSADKRGRVMALRFSHTEIFDTPVPLHQYSALVREDTGKPPVLRSVHPVSEHVFVSVLQAGNSAP